MKVFVCTVSVLSVLVLATGTSAAAHGLPLVQTIEHNAVPACATPERLTAYLRLRNPRLEERFAVVAAEYRKHGELLGLRWDYAFFQMIVETGYLTYRRPDGSPGRVSARQNNFAGLGIETRPTGHSFKSVAAGVLAHLQQIAELVEDDATFVDIAHSWTEDGQAYAEAIATVATRFYAAHCDNAETATHAASVAPEAAPAPTAIAPQLQAEPVLRREGYQRHVHAASVQDNAGLQVTFAFAAPHLVPWLETPAGSPFEYLTPDASAFTGRQASSGTTEPHAPSAAASTSAPAKPVFATAGMAAAMLPALKPEPPKAPDTPEDSVRKLVAGRTVLLDTPVGSTIPITFTENGTMRGKAGSLGSYLGAEVDEGKWWVSGARLCQRWRVWFDRETQCLTLRPAGKIVHWSSDKGHSGTARIVSQR
jgi:Mannosyl-glycoprotein endo-beta-N-acetylglucosaminidase